MKFDLPYVIGWLIRWLIVLPLSLLAWPAYILFQAAVYLMDSYEYYTYVRRGKPWKERPKWQWWY